MTEVKVPKLRFEGFDAEMEERSLGDLAWLGKGQGYSKADLRESGYPIFLYGRIYTNFQLAVTQVDTFARLQPGSVLSTGNEVLVPASGETSEDIATAVALLEPGVIIGGDLNVMRPFSEVDPVYLALRIGTGTVKDTLARRAQGKSVVHLRNSDLRGLQFSLPQLDEQKQIGTLFSELDELVAQHQRKHAKLQQTKASLLHKMFPQGDADEPELRLKGFAGAWDNRRLGDLGTTYGGLNGKTKDDFGHGEGRYVTYVDVFQRARILDASQCGRVKLDPKQHTVKNGDALFTVSSETPEEVGMSAVWLADDANVYLNSFCFGFRPTVQLDSAFFAYVLRSPAVRRQFALLAQGISRFNISKNKAMDIEVRFPSVPEQRTIGAVFSEVDDLMAAHRAYIDKLRQVKTGLLQEMFV